VQLVSKYVLASVCVTYVRFCLVWKRKTLRRYFPQICFSVWH